VPNRRLKPAALTGIYGAEEERRRRICFGVWAR
jgi:hypothetical protein